MTPAKFTYIAALTLACATCMYLTNGGGAHGAFAAGMVGLAAAVWFAVRGWRRV